MEDNLDKTRPERTGERAFVGTGVGTIPDIMEEQKDLRQMMEDMINEALSNVVGATEIRAPDQIGYSFLSGGITQAQLDKAIYELYDIMIELYHHLFNSLMGSINYMGMRINDLQQQINDLQSGTASCIRQAYVKTTPGATTTLACYLDVDATGDEISVACVIDGGGNLNACAPSVVDGDYIWVKLVVDTWVNVTPFMAVEGCEE